jgi:hypothetical protein
MTTNDQKVLKNIFDNFFINTALKHTIYFVTSQFWISIVSEILS